MVFCTNNELLLHYRQNSKGGKHTKAAGYKKYGN
jgi:hypothetical protein